MNKKLLYTFLLGALVTTGQTTTQAQTKSIDDRVSELEVNSALNIVRFSGSLETFYDVIASSQEATISPLITNAAADSKFDDRTTYMRVRSSLNADAAISDKIKFYSRYTMTKFSNKFYENTKTTPTVNPDFSNARSSRGDQVYVEKAFADITLGSGFVFSFGRLPTVDGPLLNMVNGKSRQGTYPGLIYNAVLDGAAVSYSNSIDQHKFSARLIYTPLSYINNNSYLQNPVFGTTEVDSKIDLTSVMLEYNADFGDIGNFLLMYQGYKTGKFTLNGSVIGGSNAQNLSWNIAAHSLTAQLDRIVATGLSLGASYLTSEINNEGAITTNAVPLLNYYGVGADAKDQTVKGATTLISAKYDFNMGLGIGLESVKVEKGSFVYDVATDYLTNFYSNAGTGMHAYLRYKFTPEFQVRLGYMDQKVSHNRLTFGPQYEIDRKINTSYANLRLDF